MRKSVKVYLSLILLFLVFTASPVLAANETPLKTGTYIVGTDIPEGLQQFSTWDPATIEMKRGTAELVNETIGKTGADTQSFFNARLKAGDEIIITASESANMQLKSLNEIELGKLPAGLYEAGIDIPEGTYSVFPSILNSVTITVVKILDQNGVRITSTHTDLDDPLEHTFTTGQLLLVTGTDIWGLTKKVQKPQTLALSKSALDLAIRQNYKVTATVGPENAADKEIIWKSSNTKVATVDANGNIKGVASGRAVITATAKGNARVSKTVSVKVSPKTVKVSKTNVSVTAGKKTKLTATVLPADSTNKAVKWTSSNTKIASVDSKGNVTAKAKGKAVITASAKDAKAAKINVSVKPPIAAKSVKLNRTSAKVSKGKSLQLAATVSPANTTNKNITWSSSNKKVATVDSKGKVKAVGAGTAKITARTANGKTVSATITVPYMKSLGAGTWKAGRDLPAGRYQITTASGSGNLFIAEHSYERYINEILGDGEDEFDVTVVTTDIKAGDKIEIIGLNSVQFTRVPHVKSNRLHAGNWTVGKDIAPGRYKITTPAGSGNLLVDRGDSLLVNEILSSKPEAYTVTSVTTTLKTGDHISIVGLNEVRFARK